jgi:8-oxo-dGTP diphosphatase
MQVAKAIIFDAKHRVLVLRRSGTHPTHAYHLDLPGGEVEADEAPDTGVSREVFEETGLTIDPAKFTCVHERQRADDRHYLLYAVTVNTVQPAVVISWEHDQSMWLTPEELLSKELPENVDSYYAMVVEYMQKGTVRDEKDTVATSNIYS